MSVSGLDRMEELIRGLRGPPGHPGVGKPGRQGRPGKQGIPGTYLTTCDLFSIVHSFFSISSQLKTNEFIIVYKN